MNFQNLLPRGYGMAELEEEETEVIENPYDMDYRARRSTDATYDLGVLNTSIPAEEIVEMVQNAIAYDKSHNGGPRGIRMLFYGLSGGGKTKLAHYIADSLRSNANPLCPGVHEIPEGENGERPRNFVDHSLPDQAVYSAPSFTSLDASF
ncbi:MAG: hypothetical protein J6Y16_11435 [Treponema sp.]|nr:hypothetical protein [Treponema sp.]